MASLSSGTFQMEGRDIIFSVDHGEDTHIPTKAEERDLRGMSNCRAVRPEHIYSWSCSLRSWRPSHCPASPPTSAKRSQTILQYPSEARVKCLSVQNWLSLLHVRFPHHFSVGLSLCLCKKGPGSEVCTLCPLSSLAPRGPASTQCSCLSASLPSSPLPTPVWGDCVVRNGPEIVFFIG